MKKRVFHVLNFLAFNLLFFALYLNFIHKDNNFPEVAGHKIPTASVQSTILVNNADLYQNKQTVKVAEPVQQNSIDKKVSYN